MSGQIAARLQSLAAERDKGRRALAEVQGDIAALEAERRRLQDQLLRIDGAIKVLEEIAESGGPDG